MMWWADTSALENCPDTGNSGDESMRRTSPWTISQRSGDFYQIKLNKAIRDGKYLARPIPVHGNVHAIKIFLCSLEFLYN